MRETAGFLTPANPTRLRQFLHTDVPEENDKNCKLLGTQWTATLKIDDAALGLEAGARAQLLDWLDNLQTEWKAKAKEDEDMCGSLGYFRFTKSAGGAAAGGGAGAGASSSAAPKPALAAAPDLSGKRPVEGEAAGDARPRKRVRGSPRWVEETRGLGYAEKKKLSYQLRIAETSAPASQARFCHLVVSGATTLFALEKAFGACFGLLKGPYKHEPPAGTGIRDGAVFASWEGAPVASSGKDKKERKVADLFNSPEDVLRLSVGGSATFAIQLEGITTPGYHKSNFALPRYVGGKGPGLVDKDDLAFILMDGRMPKVNVPHGSTQAHIKELVLNGARLPLFDVNGEAFCPWSCYNETGSIDQEFSGQQKARDYTFPDGE